MTVSAELVRTQRRGEERREYSESAGTAALTANRE